MDSNLNNNCSNITDSSHDVPNQWAHAQFDSLVQRARAKGFIVNDAMYFDGKQYVPIKVASNGRGKFRLLLPPDHPHRKGVDDEIPILKTFEMDSNCQEEMETGEDSFSENNWEVNPDHAGSNYYWNIFRFGCIRIHWNYTRMQILLLKWVFENEYEYEYSYCIRIHWNYTLMQILLLKWVFENEYEYSYCIRIHWNYTLMEILLLKWVFEKEYEYSYSNTF